MFSGKYLNEPLIDTYLTLNVGILCSFFCEAELPVEEKGLTKKQWKWNQTGMKKRMIWKVINRLHSQIVSSWARAVWYSSFLKEGLWERQACSLPCLSRGLLPPYSSVVIELLRREPLTCIPQNVDWAILIVLNSTVILRRVHFH